VTGLLVMSCAIANLTTHLDWPRWQATCSPMRGPARTVAKLWQSVFGRLAGYENVNDAERLRHDPAMRWIAGGKAPQGRAASPSQMGR
jgi:hypothetical protein